jgi:hypothetical protein
VRSHLRQLLVLVICVSTAAALAQTQRVGSEFRVNSTTTAYQDAPQVARNGAGAFVVVWEAAPFSNGVPQDGSSSGIFGQRFDANGVKQGGEFQVNTYTTGPQSYPYVSMDNSGNFAVVWQSLMQDGALQGNYGQRFNSSAVKVGSEFRLNTYTTGEQTSPSVDYDGSGNFVAVWESYGQVGSYVGIFGQRWSGAGVAAGSEFRANTYTRDDQGYPQVSKDGAGNFVVVWHSYSQDGDGYGIWGQRYSSTGSQSGPDFQVNVYTSHSQQFPSVSRNTAGAFVVSWESYAQDGSDYGVFVGGGVSTVGWIESPPSGTELLASPIWATTAASPRSSGSRHSRCPLDSPRKACLWALSSSAASFPKEDCSCSATPSSRPRTTAGRR